jgi:hypothetical protein
VNSPSEESAAATGGVGGDRVELSSPGEVPPPIWAIGPDAVANGTQPGPPPGFDGVIPDSGPYDAPPPDWVPIVEETAYRATPRDLTIEGIAAVVVAIVLAGLGAALSYVWAAISPRVVLEMTETGPVYTEPNPEGYVGGESVYLLMAVGVGIVSAVAVWLLLRKRRGPVLLAGLAIGSIAGGALMAWLGQRIGLAEYQRLLSDAPVGSRFEVPVKVRSALIDLPGLRIQGAVLIQAMIAVALYTLLAGFYATASLRPERAVVRFVPPHQPYPADQPENAEQPDLSSGWPEKSDPRAAQAPPAAG